MTVDPHTLAAELRMQIADVESEYPWARDPERRDCADFIESMVPLYDAWLKANPTCPTCGGLEEIVALLPTQMFDEYGVPTAIVNVDVIDDCPDCPDRPGVLPFDRWTAGLVALWTADQAARAANPIFGEFDGAR